MREKQQLSGLFVTGIKIILYKEFVNLVDLLADCDTILNRR